MSQENLKEVEIITQRIEDPQEGGEKLNGINQPLSENNQMNENNDSQSDIAYIPDEKLFSQKSIQRNQGTSQQRKSQYENDIEITNQQLNIEQFKNDSNQVSNNNTLHQNSQQSPEKNTKKSMTQQSLTNGQQHNQKVISEINKQDIVKQGSLNPIYQQYDERATEELLRDTSNKNETNFNTGQSKMKQKDSPEKSRNNLENDEKKEIQTQRDKPVANSAQVYPVKISSNSNHNVEDNFENHANNQGGTPISTNKRNDNKSNIDTKLPPTLVVDDKQYNPSNVQSQQSISPNKNNCPRSSEGTMMNGQQEEQKESKKKKKKNQKESEEKGLFDDDDDEIQKSKFPKIEKIIDNNIYQTFVTIITVYALFGDDIRVMTTTKSADIVFDVITIFCLFVFAVEIVMSMLSKPGYTWSFFFWLDIISTISLIIDIQLISNEIFYGGGDSSSSVDASQFAQAGKASRVGTKAGRVVRLVRLIRIVKLYKLSQEQVEIQNQQQQRILQQRQKKKQIHPNRQARAAVIGGDNPSVPSNLQPNQNIQNIQSMGVNGSKRGSIQSPNTKRESILQKDKPPESFTKESRVSKRLSDLTTKRVIIIVLLLLFIMPLFSADYFYDRPSSIDFATEQFRYLAQQKTTQKDLENLFNDIVSVHKKKDGGVLSPLALFATPFSFIKSYEMDDLNELRFEDQDKAQYELSLTKFEQNHTAADFTTISYDTEVANLKSKKEVYITGMLTTRSTNIISAGLSFGRTIFVCIVLTCGALYFSKDATDLALRPLERLIDKVNKIAKNPISAKDQQLVKGENAEAQLETIIIENAIVKIGVLLALGFGDAGSEIIGSNMQKSGDVDPMIPGAKKCAIYGFCDIRNFTDATEVLQEDVMLFVNNIGEVVHTMTDRFQGAANKNIGDAFLLVWKIGIDKYNIKDNNEIVFHDKPYISKLCDMALISFMKIQVKLNREPKILAYREDTRLTNRMKNYKVRMGYGLHIGWGIEGAIGSEYKIDASYLSPNVNMAARLEAATKQFGTAILISSALQQQFTPEMKKITRYIDCVTVKGSNQPIGLYTVDMQLENLEPSKDPEVAYPGLSKHDKQQLSSQKKMEIQIFLDKPEEWEWNVDEFFKNNKDLKMALQNRDVAFHDLFSQGFQQYLMGNWGQAKAVFTECKKTHPDDGPMMSLLGVMEELNFQAPSDWAGYRVLTEK